MTDANSAGIFRLLASHSCFLRRKCNGHEKNNGTEYSLWKIELFRKYYWEYYCELEDELLQTRRYVDFSKDNFSCYSVEFLKLYQAVCNEIDVLGKEMARDIDSSFQIDDRSNNIYKLWYIVERNYHLITSTHMKLNDSFTPKSYEIGDYQCMFLEKIQVAPWIGFQVEIKEVIDKNGRTSRRYLTKKGANTPEWWKCYNKVKHVRTSVNKGTQQMNYTLANLGTL